MSDQNPDIFDSLEQDTAGDVDDDSYVAPDEPMGSHAFGTTTAEQREGETFQQRTRHTNPDVFDEDLAEPVDTIGRLVQPGDEDVDLTDNESNTVAWDRGTDDDMSAEESAMHKAE